MHRREERREDKGERRRGTIRLKKSSFSDVILHLTLHEWGRKGAREKKKYHQKNRNITKGFYEYKQNG